MNWWIVLAFALGIVAGGIAVFVAVCMYIAKSFGRSF